jgi:glycolate oxidase FAD binding subunit
MSFSLSEDGLSADLTEALADRVRTASADQVALRIVGGDTKAWYGRHGSGEALEVSGHRGIVDYDPTELVITARAGTPIAEIEGLLARNRQVLGFEPPIFGAASTIGGAIAAGLAGPARPYAGAVRDHVLGARVMDGRGRVLRFGGTVFKNVAGFDAFRLMSGAMGTLGVILDVSLRVAPRPEARAARSYQRDWPSARSWLAAVMRRPLPLDGAFHDGERLHLRLSGPAAGVAEATGELGGETDDLAVWDSLRHMRLAPLTAGRLWRLSVPRTAPFEAPQGRELVDWAGAQRWIDTDAPAEQVRAVASAAGGHATLFRGAGPGEEVFTPLPAPLLALHRRLKAVFDPAGVFNPGRLYEGL